MVRRTPLTNSCNRQHTIKHIAGGKMLILSFSLCIENTLSKYKLHRENMTVLIFDKKASTRRAFGLYVSIEKQLPK